MNTALDICLLFVEKVGERTVSPARFEGIRLQGINVVFRFLQTRSQITLNNLVMFPWSGTNGLPPHFSGPTVRRCDLTF
jgi:hypothetical protein